MNVNELNKRITIQRLENVKDEHNISKQKWNDIKPCWASIKKLKGKEYWSAKKYNQENNLVIKIRYNSCPDLSKKDRIKWKNIFYNITDVDNVDYKNEELLITVEEKQVKCQ